MSDDSKSCRALHLKESVSLLYLTPGRDPQEVIVPISCAPSPDDRNPKAALLSD